MKRILYLSFYFEPDLSAGSFRNTSLAKELAEQAGKRDIAVDVITTFPNRYSTFTQEAKSFESHGNLSVTRIKIPTHKNGFRDQITSFKTFYDQVKKRAKQEKYDLIFASSGRLFSAHLAQRLSVALKIPLYLDIRDIFVDTIKEVVSFPVVTPVLIGVLKQIEKRTFSKAQHINLISEGFKEYFNQYDKPEYSYFTNGIDPVFLEHALKTNPVRKENSVKTIVYAGNIGEGQGLHKVVPRAAKLLGPGYRFRIIGDGGAKSKLQSALKELDVSNVDLLNPVPRNLLIKEYDQAEFLFIHLNDYNAFKKVLPSKLFELGVFNKPMIAGVAGYARKFLSESIKSGLLLFNPCDAVEMVKLVKEYQPGQPIDRTDFNQKFSRDNINKQMASSILLYV